MFIEFKDLAGILVFGIILSFFYALLGAMPFTMPFMLVVLLIAAVVCGNMR